MKQAVERKQEYILSLSYGKDSLACLGAIEKLGWPLDRIIHSEVWATDTIQADLPPMVEFKKQADSIIKERIGIAVEHISAERNYDEVFYRFRRNGKIYGWPCVIGPWCNGELKRAALNKAKQSNGIYYLGIASDEPGRFHNLTEKKKSPLVEVGWTEAMCREWCEKNKLLSPIYDTAMRGGCWFCHNQSVNQLRLLRRNYPEYWALMLKWDGDSPAPFRTDGHTVHDYDLRFQMEDVGFIRADDRFFRWSMLNEALNYRLF